MKRLQLIEISNFKTLLLIRVGERLEIMRNALRDEKNIKKRDKLNNFIDLDEKIYNFTHDMWIQMEESMFKSAKANSALLKAGKKIKELEEENDKLKEQIKFLDQNET